MNTQVDSYNESLFAQHRKLCNKCLQMYSVHGKGGNSCLGLVYDCLMAFLSTLLHFKLFFLYFIFFSHVVSVSSGQKFSSITFFVNTILSLILIASYYSISFMELLLGLGKSFFCTYSGECSRLACRYSKCSGAIFCHSIQKN